MNRSKRSILPKHWLASMFLFALFFQSLVQIFNIIHFEFNKEEIIKSSCVQKDAVKNCCQGSCHINSKLNLSKTPDTAQTESQPTIVFPDVYFEKQPNRNLNSVSFFSVFPFNKEIHFIKCLFSDIDSPPPESFS